MNSTSGDTDVHRLLREAAQWRLIGLLFECPVDGWHDQFKGLATEVDDASLREAAELARDEASQGLYHTTFGPGGPAPPREVSYRETVHPGRFLAEIRDCYQAFAYTPSTPETPDHVATEAGFIGYLRLKEAYARECGDAESAAVCHSAAERFLEEHLSIIAEPLARSLEASGVGYLERAGAALLDRVGPPESSQRHSP
jgi:nitrate reductase assembly molybdenum cofactor insertion protein NarJ